MRTTDVFLDPINVGRFHASPTCEQNLGLLFEIESAVGPVDFVDDLVASATGRGYVVSTWHARNMQPCAHCCLAATAQWAIAA